MTDPQPNEQTIADTRSEGVLSPADRSSTGGVFSPRSVITDIAGGLDSTRRSPYFQTHSPLSSFVSDRETVLHPMSPGRTLEETHLIRHEGAQDLFYTEEHWTSEIKSFVSFTPPKFIQVIKAYRVASSDRLTLVVEVSSEPPALFEWFCNDKPVALNRQKFQVRHNLNVTTLTVENPAQGFYSCSARNPAGISKSYGYITVIGDEARRKLLTSSDEFLATDIYTPNQEQQHVLQRPPKFISQVPHLTLKPGAEAIVDVEVVSSSNVKFIWYVNGRRILPITANVEFYDPSNTRSIVLFKLPESGQYTVVAQNEYGIAKSSAYIEVEKDSSNETHLHLLQHQQHAPLPNGTNISSSVTLPKTRPFPVAPNAATQRSSSLPRTGSPEADKEKVAPKSYETETFATITETSTFLSAQSQQQQRSSSSRFTPQPPAFINQLPSEITVNPNEKLTLIAEVVAAPPAEIKWNINGFEIRKSKNYSLENEQNKSRLIVHSPIKQGRYSVAARNDMGTVTMGTTVHTATVNLPVFTETAITATSDVEESDDSVATVKMNDSGNETDQAGVFPQKPVILGDPPMEVMIPEGEGLCLEFKVAAYPEAKIQWYQNNFELKAGDGVKIERVGSNISRLSIVTPSEGLFRATATNTLGQTTYECRVFTEIDPVKERVIFTRKSLSKSPQPIYKLRRRGSLNQRSDLPKPPKIVTGFAPTHRVKVNEPLVLDVEAEAIPEADFQWRVNNFEIKPNKSIKIEKVDENRSRIVFLQPIEGRYDVIATNYLGKDHLSTKVIVDYAYGSDQNNQFPIFLDALPLTTILASDTMEHVMVVVVRTSEPGSFRWFADGNELETNANHEIISESLKSTLIIRCMVPNDTEYAVEFTNSLGIIHSKTTVMTSPKSRPKTPTDKPPRFIELLSSTAIAQGDILEARVTVGEDTEPCEFEWSLQGVKVKPEFVMSSHFESIIRIPNASKDMSGLLRVIAKNKLGQAESSMHFIVVDGAGEKQVKIIQDTMHASPRQAAGNVQAKEEVDKDLLKAAETIADQLLAGLPGSPPAIPPLTPPKLPSPPPVEVHAQVEITKGPISDVSTEAEISDLEHDGKTEVTAPLSPSVVVKEATPPAPATDESSVAAAQKDVTVLDTEEDYSKTTKIRKREGGGIDSFVEMLTHITQPRIPETYSLLVKVAESLGQSLAAKIVLDAMHDAARHLATTTTATSSEESESEGGGIKISPSLTLAPTFEISKETYNINSGENVTIHTQIEGAPCSKVEWFKEGVLVEENDQISVITTEGHTQLVMKKVGKGNAGIYTCIATNPYGTATYQCTIHVTDPDGEIAGPYVTEIQKIEGDPTQTISNNVEIHKKHDQFDQEVIVEYLPFENTEERAVAKTTKKRSRDEQRKKKRLSMESLKSTGSDISERMETIDEPGIGSDVKAGDIVQGKDIKTEGKVADATKDKEDIQLPPTEATNEEAKLQKAPQQQAAAATPETTPTSEQQKVSETTAAKQQLAEEKQQAAAAASETTPTTTEQQQVSEIAAAEKQHQQPEEAQIQQAAAATPETTTTTEQQKVSEIATAEKKQQQSELPVTQEQQQQPESQETKIIVQASGTEQHTEVDVTEKIEELTPQGEIKREENEGAALKADNEQQTTPNQPKEVVLSFDKAVGEEQTIIVPENVETIEVEKDVIEGKMDEKKEIEGQEEKEEGKTEGEKVEEAKPEAQGVKEDKEGVTEKAPQSVEEKDKTEVQQGDQKTEGAKLKTDEMQGHKLEEQKEAKEGKTEPEKPQQIEEKGVTAEAKADQMTVDTAAKPGESTKTGPEEPAKTEKVDDQIVPEKSEQPGETQRTEASAESEQQQQPQEKTGTKLVEEKLASAEDVKSAEKPLPTMDEFMADLDIAEFINKLVDTITTEAEYESEQELKKLLANQTMEPEPRQASPSPTKAILTLEEQLKQLQKDLDETGFQIPEGVTHELNIEKEFEKEVEREEALAEARKRYSREPSEDTILEEPEIEEAFEVISKQDVKLSKDGSKGQAGETLPQSPTEFRKIDIPEITLTNESGEPVVEMITSITDMEIITDQAQGEAANATTESTETASVEATAPEVNIEITKDDATFTYHLRIVQPQLLIVSAELSGTMLSNQRIISVSEDITKIPDQSGIEVSVLTPALTKENVIYKWILKKEGGATEARDTWILNRKEEPTSPTSPEAIATANINVAYSGLSHPVVEISMLEGSKLLTEVLSEIPKSQSTTTSLTSQTYVTAKEGLDSEDQSRDQPSTTLDEQSQSTITETSTSGINQAPSFRQEIQNATFVIGQSAQLKCIVAGNPSPQVEWFVDGDLIVSNDEYEIIYEDGVSVLRFRRVIAEDEGEYVCKAFNVAGHKTTKCFVKIQENFSPTISSRYPSSDPLLSISSLSMPISDNYFLRKIKRLHKGTSQQDISSASSGIQGKKYSSDENSWYYNEPTKPLITDKTENFAIHKYFEADYLKHRIPIKADFASAVFHTTLWAFHGQGDKPNPVGDIMNWSTPSASTEVETVMQGRKSSNAMVDSDLWENGFDSSNPTPVSSVQRSEPRTPSLPEKVTYRGYPVDLHNPDGRISPVQKYIESLCDFSDIFSDLNMQIQNQQSTMKRFSTLPAARQPSIKPLHHTQSADMSNPSAPRSFAMDNLMTPANPETGRLTPLILKSSNWRCKSAKIVDITQEWIIAKDEESFSAQAYFCPLASLTPTLPEGCSPVPESRELTPQPRRQGDYWQKPRHSSPVKKYITQEDYNFLKKTVDEVASDLDEAREQYRKNIDSDALEIEKVILEMSEKLAQAAPVSKAQAEVNEELLRTRLAEMILNLPIGHYETATPNAIPPVVNPAENYELIKEPITILREKLSNLEKSLVLDEELSIKEELRQITKNPNSPTSIKKQKILRRRSENLARMTPLIHVVKNKLTTLEDVVEDNEEKTAARRSGKATPISDRRTLHELLLKINVEINNIHDLCRRSRQIDSLNTVINVLSKVCTHLDSILDTLRVWQGSNNTLILNVEEDNGKQQMVERKVSSQGRSSISESGRRRSTETAQSVSTSSFYESQQSLPPPAIMVSKDKSQQLQQLQEQLQQMHEKQQPQQSQQPVSQRQQPVQQLVQQQHQYQQQPQKQQLPYQAPQQQQVPQQHYPQHQQPLQQQLYQQPQQPQYQPQQPPRQQQQVPRRSISSQADPEMPMVNCNVDLKKEEEHEMTNTFVMFTSSSEKSTIGTSVALTFSKAEENLSTAFTHNQQKTAYDQKDRATAYIQMSPMPLRKLMLNAQKEPSPEKIMSPPPFATAVPQTAIVEVPYIHLTSPNYLPESSDTNMEVSIHLRRRGDHQKAEIILPYAYLNRHLSQIMTGDNASVQMICEESDAGTDTDTTSAFFRGGVKTFFPNHPIEEESSDVISFTSEDSPLPRHKLLGQPRSPYLGRNPNVESYSNASFTILPSIKSRDSVQLTDEEGDDEKSFVQVTNVRNSLNENFDLARKKRNYKVNAVLYPEQRATTEVTFLKDHVDVNVEKMSEKGRDSAMMLEEAFDQAAVKLHEPSEYSRQSTPRPDNFSSKYTSTSDVNTAADLSISVNAKTMTDKVYVHLEEIPWGEVSMTIGDNTFDNMSDTKSSILFNVMVSENQEMSQKSDNTLSHRSSQKSLTTVTTDKTLSNPSLNIPTYIIKHLSTASITCELNNYVNKDTSMEWYKGKEPLRISKSHGKYDRISHDLLEVLVINKIEYEDSELYSIKVNGELYPVAYLIVEDTGANTASSVTSSTTNNIFISPSKTMFVMEGQKSQISCQMKESNLNIAWYRDQEMVQESHRIHLLATNDGWYHVIIDETETSDQGTYYAYYEDSSTYITLVVEEKIDEKEVVVSGPETDDEDLNDYLVPPGSTATIACELESSEFLRDLVWQRNNKNLRMNDKLEHVVNGNKHYLIIHNAQPEDSGVYSVSINDTQFKVAQITITEGSQILSGSRLKRISNNSLQSFRS